MDLPLAGFIGLVIQHMKADTKLPNDRIIIGSAIVGIMLYSLNHPPVAPYGNWFAAAGTFAITSVGSASALEHLGLAPKTNSR